ncbi:VacJ family lipoprotein [Pseudosulfitobacter sp. DSM 107133]|uniref:MlaA family lipoprotein n=1 Tax=Pseudosulfitobacter sp. DSM 107133 TaxID=2883100 RepID=UPI001F07A42D|nr:VacJ family lipoprotein [Pseudosulfitobacter sp. DSM 107133]UOA28563.1 putative phospholipid-binding lipoprotein MlaA [Pseudosulfitobacter sp. DSM 107133]
MPVYRFQHHVARMPIFILALALVSACAAPDPGAVTRDGIYDPNEAKNRKVHAFNLGLDKAILRPAGRGYSNAVPDGIEDSIGNFATNLAQPSVIVNSVLQGDLRGAGLSTVRFLTNTVLGFGGFVDAATEFKVPQHDTDFGETLYVWGAGEGPYVELPVVGPATRRDAVGRVVDLFTNPLSYRLPTPESYYATGAKLASRLGDRGRYSDTVDSILYESADSYAQARLIYLQNRRFELGSSAGADSADPYSDDPYSDIYEDPYAQ